MSERSVPHVKAPDISSRGIGPIGSAATDAAPTTRVRPQEGSIVQEMGTRETWVWDGFRWLPQNDDLGAKLDVIAANTARTAIASERALEFLELLAEKL